eukprot:m.297208 g.297208  ORF g.297208 m.297208 type:complete len:331 (+) comp27198_c0_seq2:63-1055(+)
MAAIGIVVEEDTVTDTGVQPAFPAPPWLTDAADYVCESDAWRAVVDDVVEWGVANRQQERASRLDLHSHGNLDGIGSTAGRGQAPFTHLSATEQSAEIDAATVALSETEGYIELAQLVAHSVNDALTTHAASAVGVSDVAASADEREAAVLEASGWGIAAILRKHPDQQRRLTECLGSELPAGLRRWVWASVLRDQVAADAFHTGISAGIDDPALVARCTEFLESRELYGWRTTATDSPNSAAANQQLAQALSVILYCWRSRHEGDSLDDVHLALAAPIAWVSVALLLRLHSYRSCRTAGHIGDVFRHPSIYSTLWTAISTSAQSVCDFV